MAGQENSLIDRELGLSYSGYMEDLYRELLKTFCDMRKDKGKQLEEAFSEGNWELYSITAHALKSTSLNIGAKSLSKAAKALELAGKAYVSAESGSEEAEEHLKYIKEHHGEFLDLYDAVIREAESI